MGRLRGIIKPRVKVMIEKPIKAQSWRPAQSAPLRKFSEPAISMKALSENRNIWLSVFKIAKRKL